MKSSNKNQQNIIEDILKERSRQDGKWGEQNHHPFIWTGILGEEFGELCEAINETIFDNGTDKGGYSNIKKEAIHVAAVAIGFIECLERNKFNWGLDVIEQQECRVCGCTDLNACHGGCYWVEQDLCSRCAEELARGNES